jgi:hypothetical protein
MHTIGLSALEKEKKIKTWNSDHLTKHLEWQVPDNRSPFSDI